jgi:hypothetical protein
MEFIVANPLLFLFLTIVFGVLAIVFQVRNMKSLHNSFFKEKTYPTNGVFASFIPVAILGLLSSATGILFVIGVVKYLMKG